jgi:hypothetical protein
LFFYIAEETEEELGGILLDAGVDRLSVEFHVGNELFGVDDVFYGVAELHEYGFQLFQFVDLLFCFVAFFEE